MPDCSTVAVVDDDTSVCRAVSRLLRASGYDVVSFSSAEEFLVRRDDVDCLVLDVHLPGISGPELASRLQKAGRPTPIVFMTALDDVGTQEAVRQTGRPWLRKPFPVEGLLEAVAQATHRPARHLVN